MTDVLSQHIAAPVPVTIAGKSYLLSYSMHAVIVYQQETARIERSRPRAEDPDPRCNCGARKSAHVGPGLIRLTDTQELLCVAFRAQDPLLGDSLFVGENWLRIDLNIDPERWMACLWAGLWQREGSKWTAPLALDELQELIGLSRDARAVGEIMLEAMRAWMPKPKPKPKSERKEPPDPNAQPAGAMIVTPETESAINTTTSPTSGPALVADLALPATSS